MTKPWESNLFVAPCNHNDYCLSEDGDRMVAIFRRQEAEEWKAFLVAAPNMARALRDALSVLHRAEDVLEMGQVRGLRDACETVEAALRKAGMIP